MPSVGFRDNVEDIPEGEPNRGPLSLSTACMAPTRPLVSDDAINGCVALPIAALLRRDLAIQTRRSHACLESKVESDL